MSAENPQEQPAVPEQAVGRVPIRALLHEKMYTTGIFVGSFATFEAASQRDYGKVAVYGLLAALNMTMAYPRLAARAPLVTQEVDTPE